MSIGLWGPLEDGERDVLKRFEQTLGRRSGRFASGIAGVKSSEPRPLRCQLTAADTCQQRQHPQGNRSEPDAPRGMVVALHIHRGEGERPPFASPQTPLHLLFIAIGQHRLLQ